MASPNWIQEKTQLAPATVNACLRELEKVNILNKLTEFLLIAVVHALTFFCPGQEISG